MQDIGRTELPARLTSVYNMLPSGSIPQIGLLKSHGLLFQLSHPHLQIFGDKSAIIIIIMLIRNLIRLIHIKVSIFVYDSDFTVFQYRKEQQKDQS